MYCAVKNGDPYAYGFYSLGVTATDPKNLDADITRDHEGAGLLPFIYLHALAVRKEHKRHKIGTMLLIDALRRSARFVREVGIYGLALNAIADDWRLTLYAKYGFGQRNEMKYPLMIMPGQTLLDLTEGEPLPT